VAAPPSRDSSSPWIVAGLLVLAFLAATIAFDRQLIQADQYDDAYITYRYAEHLATGKGLVFNSYERINSASSFLYTIVLAAAYRIGFHDMELFAAIFGLVMGSLLIAVTFVMTRRATSSGAGAALFTAPLCLAGSIGGWAVSGMDTIFFAALVAVFLHLYLFTRAARPATFSLLGLILLSRLEGLILFALVAGREILMAWISRKRRDLLWLALCAGVPLLVLLAFDFAYYGTITPQAWAFKRIARFYAPGFVPQVVSLGTFYLGYYVGYVLLAGVAMVDAARACLKNKRTVLAPIPFLSAYVVLSFASFTVGPFSDMQRYTVHILPVLAVLGLVGGLALLDRLRGLQVPRTRQLAIGAVALILAGGALSNGLGTAQQLEAISAQQGARRQMGLWLRRNTKPGDLIASVDLGEIAYWATGRDFVDVYGLTTGAFARLSQTRPDLMQALFAEWRPAYIADTARPTLPAGRDRSGSLETSTEFVLAKPSLVFWNVAADPPAPVRALYVATPVLSLHAGDRDFVIKKLAWDPAPNANGR
jgi:hypothetical protein